MNIRLYPSKASLIKHGYVENNEFVFYKFRFEQFRQNRIFDFDQKKMYAEFNGDGVRSSDVPNAEESKRF